MKFLFSSDIHFGFSERTASIHESLRLKRLSSLDFDAVVIAGDLGTAKLAHLESACKFLRRLAGDRPVFVVLGNHDFWDRRVYSFAHIKRRQAEILDRHKITNLETLLEIDNPEAFLRASTAAGVTFVGYAGWYATPYPATNDPAHIPEFTKADGSNHALVRRSDAAARLAGDRAEFARDMGHRVVVVTHFPIFKGDPAWKKDYAGNPRHFDLFDGRCDVLCFGHSHHRLDVTTEKGTRVLNVGGDYDNPRYMIVEL
jgi:predicted phosphodiesterase